MLKTRQAKPFSSLYLACQVNPLLILHNPGQLSQVNLHNLAFWYTNNLAVIAAIKGGHTRIKFLSVDL